MWRPNGEKAQGTPVCHLGQLPHCGPGTLLGSAGARAEPGVARTVVGRMLHGKQREARLQARDQMPALQWVVSISVPPHLPQLLLGLHHNPEVQVCPAPSGLSSEDDPGPHAHLKKAQLGSWTSMFTQLWTGINILFYSRRGRTQLIDPLRRPRKLAGNSQRSGKDPAAGRGQRQAHGRGWGCCA